MKKPTTINGGHIDHSGSMLIFPANSRRTIVNVSVNDVHTVGVFSGNPDAGGVALGLAGNFGNVPLPACDFGDLAKNDIWVKDIFGVGFTCIMVTEVITLDG